MASRDITACCAICNDKPKDSDLGECPCETKALKKAIETAQQKWLDSWMERINDWVTNAAVNYVTGTFMALKERRIRGYTTFVNSLPYYREYRQYNGRPPIYQPYVQHLLAQLKHADRELQRGVNEDWRNCVMKYPEVLEYYYEQVHVELPQGPVSLPFTGHGSPTVYSTGPNDRRTRKGGRASAPPPAGMGFAMPPDDGISRRNSQRHNRRNSGSYVLSGPKRPTVPIPPTNVPPGYNGYA